MICRSIISKSLPLYKPTLSQEFLLNLHFWIVKSSAIVCISLKMTFNLVFVIFWSSVLLFFQSMWSVYCRTLFICFWSNKPSTFVRQYCLQRLRAFYYACWKWAKNAFLYFFKHITWILRTQKDWERIQ